jgi:hypothetical protein
MVDLVKEVEEERRVEAAKRAEEEAEAARAAAEEMKKRREEEEQRRRDEERLREEAEQTRRKEIEEKYRLMEEELIELFGEGGMTEAEYRRQETEIGRKRAEELGDGESEKEEEEEKIVATRKSVGKPFVEVPARRGRGRPRRSLLEFPETDVEDDFEGEVYEEREKMVRNNSFMILFDSFIGVSMIYSACDAAECGR